MVVLEGREIWQKSLTFIIPITESLWSTDGRVVIGIWIRRGMFPHQRVKVITQKKSTSIRSDPANPSISFLKCQ